ncbi:uncharacterized protein (DUF2236 family) [Knoellia remsis]|uniref:Uncharacterized protein (DUF2236 family) n=1 Tax=Knoellia remsis TaxID=407159 RepID=A0A2T0UUE5_9MICO|nr:oxygenase MpaB family protein [Knoellia remsis]PRY61545.1 uncharacterized protein (DUF2236 family) [Knoellia remsis]
MSAVDVVSGVLGPVRKGVGNALRSRVAGSDPVERSARIWGAPGERWFREGDPIWRVHGDGSMFVAGIRALLLQSLHPLAMAGVAGHSGFRGDPWGRLQRTSTFIATTTYAPAPDAERLIARVRGIHRRVVGEDEQGRPYAASDPHLLAWVHAAETDSFLTCFQRFAVRPLGSAEADTYVAQTGEIAARLGVVNPPQTVAELDAVIETFRPELETTAAALDAADFLLRHPPLDAVSRLGYAPLAAGAVGLLPSWARTMLHLPGPDLVHEQVGVRVGRGAARLVTWGLTHPDLAAERKVPA